MRNGDLNATAALPDDKKVPNKSGDQGDENQSIVFSGSESSTVKRS
jgi:hypothetical protein